MSRTDRGTKKSRGIARKALACMTSFVLAVGLMPSVALAAGEDATTPQEVKEGSAEYNSVKVDEDAMGTSQDTLRVSLTSGGQVAVKVSGDVEGTKGQRGVLYALSVYENAGESSVSVDVGGHVQATKTNNSQGATSYAVNAQSWQGSVDVGIKGAVTATSEHGNATGVNAFSNSAGSLRVSVGSASATGASTVVGIYAQNDGSASLAASIVGLVSAEGEKAYGIYALSASSNLSSVTAGSVTVKGTAESAGVRAIANDASARLSVASEGDVTATATGEGGTSAGAHLEFRKPGSVDLFVGGTLKGETAGVAVEENGSSFDAATSSITAWKVEAGEGGYVAAKKTSDGYFEDDTLAKAINYIVKIKEVTDSLEVQAEGGDKPLTGNLRAVKADGSDLDKSHKKQVAREGDKIYLKVDEGYRITSASNGNDSQKVQQDAGGFYIVVKRGGGIDIQAIVEALEYEMSFDLGGGTVNGKSTYTVPATYGSTITLPAPVREGFEFQYWEGSRYYAGDSYKVVGPHAFKAIWKEKESASEPVSEPIAETKATPTTTASSMPATGDSSPVVPVFVTLLVSLCALIVSRTKLNQRYVGKHVR